MKNTIYYLLLLAVTASAAAQTTTYIEQGGAVVIIDSNTGAFVGERNATQASGAQSKPKEGGG